VLGLLATKADVAAVTTHQAMVVVRD
jgi:hypothetical protein